MSKRYVETAGYRTGELDSSRARRPHRGPVRDGVIDSSMPGSKLVRGGFETSGDFRLNRRNEWPLSGEHNSGRRAEQQHEGAKARPPKTLDSPHTNPPQQGEVFS
jgi:hypothetical protein